MPNWCAARLYFTGGATKESVKQSMDSSGFSELLAHGVHSARALFLLVFSGVIRVRGECYGHAPFNWMTKYGGARIDFNKPIDDEASDLALSLNGVFDSDKLTRLVAFATNRRFFDTIDTLVECVAASECWKQSMALFGEVYFDYCCDMRTTTNQTRTINDRYFGWLNYYYQREEECAVRERKPDDPDGYHDMRSVIPLPVLPEINGFNGKMCADTGSWLLNPDKGYGSNVQTYGTKWPGFQFRIGVDQADNKVFLDFETAWSPPTEEYFDLLSERNPQLEEIYYAEQGIGFCGSGLVLHPGTVFWRNADLTIECEDTPDGWESCKVTSPEWIIGKVDNYGG